MELPLKIISVLFRPTKASEWRYGEVEPLYDIISPLRVLLSAPEEKEAFFGLESHLEKWKEDEGFVESHEAVVDHMRNSLGFDDAEQVGERTAAIPYLRIISTSSYSDHEDFRHFLHQRLLRPHSTIPG